MKLTRLHMKCSIGIPKVILTSTGVTKTLVNEKLGMN